MKAPAPTAPGVEDVAKRRCATSAASLSPGTDGSARGSDACKVDAWSVARGTAGTEQQ